MDSFSPDGIVGTVRCRSQIDVPIESRADSLLKNCNPSHALQAIATRIFIGLFCVKPFLHVCGKQVKCPMVVPNGMFGLRVWAEIEGHLMRRCEDVALSGPSTGAGHKDTRSDSAGSQ